LIRVSFAEIGRGRSSGTAEPTESCVNLKEYVSTQLRSA
jgi:hypothetical protein